MLAAAAAAARDRATIVPAGVTTIVDHVPEITTAYFRWCDIQNLNHAKRWPAWPSFGWRCHHFGTQVVTVEVETGVKERRRRILVVEDDISLARLYRSALRFAGFDVAIATDGLSGLAQMDADAPDLVVLDLHLPILRGESILQEIAATPHLQHIPVVIVTGEDTHTAVAQATAILRKPCAPDQLLSVVAAHLSPAA